MSVDDEGRKLEREIQAINEQLGLLETNYIKTKNQLMQRLVEIQGSLKTLQSLKKSELLASEYELSNLPM
jgi:hypothetical protein